MQDTDAELSAVFQELREQCPTLFDTPLPRSEQNVDPPVIDGEELQFISSNMHRRPTATGYIPSSFVRPTMKLQVRISDLDKNEVGWMSLAWGGVMNGRYMAYWHMMIKRRLLVEGYEFHEFHEMSYLGVKQASSGYFGAGL